MKRDCEQSHCAECMSPCSSWNKRPFSGREIHSAVPPFSRACRQSGCPHTAAPPTLLLWQIMQGRRAMSQKIQRVLKKELESLTVWVRGCHVPGIGPVSAHDLWKLRSMLGDFCMDQIGCLYIAFILWYASATCVFSCYRNCWINFFKGATTKQLNTWMKM